MLTSSTHVRNLTFGSARETCIRIYISVKKKMKKLWKTSLWCPELIPLHFMFVYSLIRVINVFRVGKIRGKTFSWNGHFSVSKTSLCVRMSQFLKKKVIMFFLYLRSWKSVFTKILFERKYNLRNKWWKLWKKFSVVSTKRFWTKFSKVCNRNIHILAMPRLEMHVGKIFCCLEKIQ